MCTILSAPLTLLILICVSAFILYWIINNVTEGATGGARRAVITHLLDLPQQIEVIDDVTGERSTYNTKRDRYMDPGTNQQIRTVATKGSPAEYGRLIQLIGKFHHGHIDRLIPLLKRSDSDIYSYLRQKFPRDQMMDQTGRDTNIAAAIYRNLHDTVSTVDTFVDIGCNRGGITRELGRLLGAKRVVGLDVIDPPAEKLPWEYHKISGPLPLDDNSVDLIMANMTLHHIEDIRKTISEVHRVLKPGGLFYIREHDCWTAMDAMLIDIEHLLYDHVGGDPGEYHMYHYTNYYGWDKIVEPLKYVKADYFYSSLRNEISPTRAYWSIYTKTEKNKRNNI